MKKEAMEYTEFIELINKHQNYVGWSGESYDTKAIRDRMDIKDTLLPKSIIIEGMKLSWSSFNNTDSIEMQLNKCTAHYARIVDSDIRRNILKHCKANDARISSTNIHDLVVEHSALDRTIVFSSCLGGCMFKHTSMQNTEFYNSNFYSVEFHDCDFTGAKFGRCYTDITFIRCNLSSVEFYDSAVQLLNLQDCENIPQGLINQTRIVPDGEFIAYKSLRENLVATLLIPADAKRSNATGRKCRASKAKVLKIETLDGKKRKSGTSWRDSSFVYRVGETIEPDDFDDDRWNVCSHGIHFYMTREECLDD